MSLQSTYRRDRDQVKGKREKEKGKAFFSFALLISFSLLPLTFSLLSGCGPRYTYPAKTVPSAVEKICLDEYGLTVHARVVGKTLGAVLFSKLDIEPDAENSKELQEKMSKVMQSLTRAALSTDMPLDFCMVALRDKAQGVEFRITRSVDDTKRANADAIGIEEAMNRTLFAQEHFPPGQDEFVVKEVKMENFLTDQTVQRIRIDYTKEGAEGESEPLVLVDGNFVDADNKRSFRFSLLALKADDPKRALLKVFKIVNDVIGGYRYTDFDSVEIQDYLNRQKLVIDRYSLNDYQKKRLNDSELLQRFVSESASIQEAFKLFGFALPQETAAATTPAP